MREIPVPGQLYRHFKNKMYQIVAIARHTETGEQLVIYQALYGDFGIYARPLDMFLSEVDHEKYPEVKQVYRFEEVEKGSLPPACSPKPQVSENEPIENGRIARTMPEADKKRAAQTLPERDDGRAAVTLPERQTFIPTQPRDRSMFRRREDVCRRSNGAKDAWTPVTVAPDAKGPDPNLMAFLEAESLEEKYMILVKMRDVITDRLIDNMAASLDVMISEGDLIRRYDELKYTIRIRMKYEDGSRLRPL